MLNVQSLLTGLLAAAGALGADRGITLFRFKKNGDRRKHHGADIEEIKLALVQSKESAVATVNASTKASIEVVADGMKELNATNHQILEAIRELTGKFETYLQMSRH